MQQIGLYKELLAQVTYQNQLLSRDITYKQQQEQAMNSLGQLKYPHNNLAGFNMQNLNYLGGMNANMGMAGLGGLGNAVSNLQNMQNMSNMAGLSGLNSNMLGGNVHYNPNAMMNDQVSLNNLINQTRSAENASKDKDQSMSNSNNANSLSGSAANFNTMNGGMGGFGGMPSNFDLIKSMVL